MDSLLRGQRAAGLGKAEYLRPARSLLLLSGTLRPFDLLAGELGFNLTDPGARAPSGRIATTRVSIGAACGRCAAVCVSATALAWTRPRPRRHHHDAI